MTHLFRFSIGPVQEFITTARRSRDLQYGSWLLSELAKAGAKTIAESEGITSLIFPAPESLDTLHPGTDFNVPNIIQALVESPPEVLGKKVEAAIKRRLNDLASDVFNKLAYQAGTDFKRAVAESQIESLLEFYWVAVPLKDEGGYIQAQHQAAAWLAARKNTRNFAPAQGEMVPKSSLDASRESVINENAYPNHKKDSQKAQEKKIEWLYSIFGARRGERLSGVDLLKRLGKSPQNEFPSTSALAAKPFIDGLPKENWDKLHRSLRAWVDSISEKAFKDDNAILLYPARLAEVLDNERLLLYPKYLTDMLRQYAAGKTPGVYYALLVADGDSMGKKVDSLNTAEEHRHLSRRLSAFADQAKGIIKKHGGTPIYVGGDDIMAYLPLHTALDCLQELGEAFSKIGTLSGGLVLAHHLEPLSEVLQLARSAEKRAKDEKGKNSLCIVSSKRSGADREVVAQWAALSGRLHTLADYHRQGLLSRGTAYELQKMYDTLHEVELPEDKVQEMMQQEALRIIKRKRQSGGNDELPQDVREQLQAWLNEVAVDELALEMIVALEFAKAKDLANLPLKEEAA